MAARNPPVVLRDAAPVGYERHRPEQTLLYRAIAEHLETFLADSRKDGRPGLPKYVEVELREYLECGILEHGFACAVCECCGRELVVAFSCKRRGVCPSCNARRMCSTACHLVDEVFPDVPVRQWVLSVPYELRLLLARRIDAFQALIRLFAREVLGWQQSLAKAGGLADSRGGGVMFPQRFGGSLNLNTHVHAVFPDGVFVRPSTAARACFVPLRAPTADELTLLCERIYARFSRWLDRHQLLEDPDANDYGVDGSADQAESDSERAALDICARAALSQGELGKVALPRLLSGNSTRVDDDDAHLLPRARKGKHVGQAGGFSIHAGVAIARGNAFGRERLFRYCARPPLSLERLSLLPDGRFAYELRHPWRPDQTHRIMTPLELLARLAALIPPPRHPLIQFHGVFAPNSFWRQSVVPAATPSIHEGGAPCSAQACGDPACCDAACDAAHSQQSEPEPTAGSKSVGAGSAAIQAPSHALLPEPAPDESGTTEEAATRSRPVSPVSPAGAGASPRAAARKKKWWIDWATLLRRVYGLDALACPCGGRLRFVDVVTQSKEAIAQLERLGLGSTEHTGLPPVCARDLDADFIDPPSPDC